GVQQEPEGAAFAHPAVDADRAAVGLHDTLGDGEAEARAALLATVRAPEALEYAVQVLRVDAGTGVGDRDANPALRRRRGNLDAAARGYELERVAEQVREHLEDAPAIHVNGGQPGLDATVEADRALARQLLEHHARLAHEESDLGPLAPDEELPRVDLRDVEQVLQESLHLLGRDADARDAGVPPIGRHVELEHGRRAGDGLQRVPQVVGHDRD